MHYYQFNIKSYQAATAHLTNEEDLAYRRLIDYYYDTEEPIKATANPVLSRRLRVGLPEIESVLKEFFVLTEEGWRHEYCDAVIAQFRAYTERQRINGSKGGRVRKADAKPKKPTALPDKPTALPDKLSAKPTNNQEPTTNEPPISPKGDRFAEFWAVWPSSARKVGKSTCEAKWRRGKLDDIADRILIHVRAMKQTEQWKTGYEPAPATYLNQKRWEDDLPTLEGSGKPAWMTGML